MSKKCKAFSASKLGLEPADNRKAFYAGWDAAIKQAEKQEPRQWVGLTNKDIIEMWPETSTVGWDDIRLIEAKLKEKNT
jgi:hypothetical protein